MATFYLAMFIFSFSHMLLGTLAFTLLEMLRLMMGQLALLLLLPDKSWVEKFDWLFL